MSDKLIAYWNRGWFTLRLVKGKLVSKAVDKKPAGVTFIRGGFENARKYAVRTWLDDLVNPDEELAKSEDEMSGELITEEVPEITPKAIKVIEREPVEKRPKVDITPKMPRLR